MTSQVECPTRWIYVTFYDICIARLELRRWRWNEERRDERITLKREGEEKLKRWAEERGKLYKVWGKDRSWGEDERKAAEHRFEAAASGGQRREPTMLNLLVLHLWSHFRLLADGSPGGRPPTHQPHHGRDSFLWVRLVRFASWLLFFLAHTAKVFKSGG